MTKRPREKSNRFGFVVSQEGFSTLFNKKTGKHLTIQQLNSVVLIKTYLNLRMWK